MTSPALPVSLRSADDVTPEVLASLLRRHDPSAIVTAVTVRRTWQALPRTCTSTWTTPILTPDCQGSCLSRPS
jgi:hypothetical protein